LAIPKYRRYYSPIVDFPSFCSDLSCRLNSIGILATRNIKEKEHENNVITVQNPAPSTVAAQNLVNLLAGEKAASVTPRFASLIIGKRATHCAVRARLT
jgi:hypothetical protein